MAPSFLLARVLAAFLALLCIGIVKASPNLLREPRQTETLISIDTPFQLDPYPDKPRLTFNSFGSFKLTIFSDLHYGENPWDEWGPQQDIKSARLMRTVLSDEKPDYVYELHPIASQLDVSDISL